MNVSDIIKDKPCESCKYKYLCKKDLDKAKKDRAYNILNNNDCWEAK